MPFSVYEIIIKNANNNKKKKYCGIVGFTKHLCYLFMIFKYDVIICIHVYVIYFIKIFLFCNCRLFSFLLCIPIKTQATGSFLQFAALIKVFVTT